MSTRLAAFILVSLSAHTLVLLEIEDVASPTLAVGGQAQALRVTLDTVPAATPTPVEPPAPAALENTQVALPKPSVTSPTRAGRVSTRALQHKTKTPSVTPTLPADDATEEHPTAAAATPPSAGAVNVSERISAALQNRLNSHFEYPWLARKRGWQGQVTLSLRVEDNGDLTHWKVSKTSGFVLLDRSALKAARRIGRLQEADRLLNGKSLNLMIPVRYLLLDS